MKRKKKVIITICTTIIIVGLSLYFAVASVFDGKLREYTGPQNFDSNQPQSDISKKTVLIVADNGGTEMFDLLAPYYLFNATGQANVFIVAEKKQPILLVNSLFILPHYTFAEIDSLNIKADILVIPNMTIHLKTPPETSTVNWIKKQYTGKNIILSICDGAATMAATGLYDGKIITTHASDFETLKKQYPGPNWVKDISVTQSGNLYSTGGVANAVEGSLTVIKETFGDGTLQKVLHDIKYPHRTIQLEHKSNKVTNGSILTAVQRYFFKKRTNIGVLLQSDVNEFDLGSMLDVYSRTLPKSLKSFTIDNKPLKSKYGLTLLPSGKLEHDQVDELKVLNPAAFTAAEERHFPKAGVELYPTVRNQYILDTYLENINKLYGKKFMNFVKLTLDYN
ncbi:MAG: DJ-1/PfpI family protein [Ferruginibacter sp.]|nr:DJ-1/PfpI family protein [Ferruginibacter sp.]